MAKNPGKDVQSIYCILILCFTFLGWDLFSQPLVRNDLENIQRTTVVRIASSYVGVREATGKNDGKQVYQFQKSVGLKSGDGWCAAFVSFCFIRADIPNPRTGVAANWFKTNVVYKQQSGKQKYEFIAKPGQVAGEVSGTRISHTSIIIGEFDKDHWITIGGNETNAVRKTIKRKKDIWIISDYIEPVKTRK